jgi:hypothetical protein
MRGFIKPPPSGLNVAQALKYTIFENKAFKKNIICLVFNTEYFIDYRYSHLIVRIIKLLILLKQT